MCDKNVTEARETEERVTRKSGAKANIMRTKPFAAVLIIALVGCQTPGPQFPSTAPSAPADVPAVRAPEPPPAEPPKPPPPPKSEAELALDAGIAIYDAGDYNGAIKSLQGAKEIWSGPDRFKVRAHKYMAFSHCVMNRRTSCRQQFVAALKLDPAFVLEPAEMTHPAWGAEYEAAKKSLAAQKPTPASKPAPAPRPPAKGT